MFKIEKRDSDQTVLVTVLGISVRLNIEDLLKALKDAGITVS